MPGSAGLADWLAVHLARWRLTPEGERVATPRAILAPVRCGPTPAMLKVFPADSEEARGARLLELWNGQGAVRVLAREATAVLLERAAPGTTLEQTVAGADAEATAILIEAIAALPALNPRDGFPAVEQLGRGFARFRHASRAGLPATLVARAEAEFHALCRTQGPRRLLHADLHHGNVLYDTVRGWLVTDPKGVIGETAYESGAMLRNPLGLPQLAADPAVMDARVSMICRRLGLERRRVLGWCFSQAVLSAIWFLEDGEGEGAAAHMIAVAGAAERLLKEH